MAARWRDPSAFRADPTATPAARPSRRQTLALVTVLVLVAGAVAIASYVIRPDRARAFDLFHGSLFLTDQFSPVAVDLASGKPTLRLVGADKQVGIVDGETLGLVPLDGGTLLLNTKTGEFNMVDSSGFVMKHDGGGVPVGGPTDQTAAMGVADGQLAYIVRTGPSRTDVYLVSQATVQSALSATNAVKPRASTTMGDIIASKAPGSAVAADGDLWLLGTATGDAANRHTIRQLRVPANSSTGAELDATDHGTITGPVAIGTAALSDGTTAVGVAGADRIDVFNGSTARPVDFPAPAGVDRILAAGNRSGRLGFLLHATNGWSLVSVRADGSQLRGPTRITGLSAADDLLPPAYSADTLYTMVKADGRIFGISSDGRARSLPSQPAYPFGEVRGKVVEPRKVGDGYVVARGSRVVFNSPSHANALMIFTDGSHPPTQFQKSEAVNVSAAGGAEVLTRTAVPTDQQPGKTPTSGNKAPKPNPGQPVNNKIDCKNVTQKPHIPTIDQAIAGSRSVSLHWTYPILDPKQDCQPTSYVVNVKKITAGSPDPASSSVPVTGQNGVDVTGLFPQTTYRISVTAVINQQGTTSDIRQIETGPEGPAAPTDLIVAADASGNWKLTWNSCGTTAQGCVRAQTWTVTPSLCDTRGVSEPPAPVTETADPTSRAQPPLLYKGSDSLLGAGLQFVVTGAGDSQVPGTPSAKTPCVHSWSPPNAGAMTLTASHPANTSLNGTTSTTVSLDLGTDPVHAVGGVGARIAFHLTGPGADQTETTTFTGTGSSISVTFPGLSAGAQYTATAAVSPPGHADRSVTLGPTPVTTAADWPGSLAVNGDCQPVGQIIQLSCDLTVSITGLSSSDAHGETFDIIDPDNDTPSGVRCGGGPNHPLAANGISLPLTSTARLSLLAFSGTCTVTIHLRESPTATPVFGGVVKTLTTTYTVGDATTYTAKSTDFAASWDPPGSQALIKYQGNDFSADQLAQITQNWNVTVQGPNGEPCGSRSFDAPPDNVDVSVTVACVRALGDQDGWSVHITYDDQGTSDTHAVPGDPNLTGPPPGFQPCNVNDSAFSATWGATQADDVTVTYGGDQVQISGCSNFAYSLQKDGVECGTAANPTPPGDSAIPTAGCDFTTPGSWTVQITWHNDDTDKDDRVKPDVKLPDPPAT